MDIGQGGKYAMLYIEITSLVESKYAVAVHGYIESFCWSVGIMGFEQGKGSCKCNCAVCKSPGMCNGGKVISIQVCNYTSM